MRKLLKYRTDFDLPEQLRKQYTVSVPNSRYNADWQKLLLSRTSLAANGTAAICNYCKRRLKQRSMPDHAIANGMWMGEASSIPEYADLSEMEAMLLASGGRTHAAIKTIYLESATAPNGKGWSIRRPNLYVFNAMLCLSAQSCASESCLRLVYASFFSEHVASFSCCGISVYFITKLIFAW